MAEEQLLKLQLLHDTYKSRLCKLAGRQLKSMSEQVERENLQKMRGSTQKQIESLKRKLSDLKM